MRSFVVFLFTGFLALSMATASIAEIELLGAGATFPYPLYSKMFDVYHKQTGVKVNYQSIGSGGGIRQLLNRAVDFGGTDAFMSEQELGKAPGEIVHVPICLGAVAVTYNLAGIGELKFTSDALSGIFLGKITKWNDPRIQAANPDVSLPDMKIVVIHRSDGSGTTFIFTDYLSKVSDQWRESVGAGKSVNWPAGLGAKGNEGVSGLVKQIPGSIGYAELAYTVQNKMQEALIQNRNGSFIKPGLESTSLAAETELPDDMRVSITNTAASEGYPISGFTWIILYKEQDYSSRSREKAEALVKLLWWMTHEGQIYTKPLHYAPIPAQAAMQVERILESITYGGEEIGVEK
ncbi:MAG: phosphate ABC transporter substrate-binding protein PstS [Candidatus Glassbacteria bacterium]